MLAANYPPPVLPIRGRGAVPGASVHRLSMENGLAQSVDDFFAEECLPGGTHGTNNAPGWPAAAAD